MLNTPSDLATSLLEEEGLKQLAVGGGGGAIELITKKLMNKIQTKTSIFLAIY